MKSWLIYMLIFAGAVAVVADEPNRIDVTKPNEQAGSSALKWLETQQNEDGGWTAGDDARAASPTENTGLVVLAYLGAGQTHREGEYKKTIHAGLKYLVSQLKVVEKTGDLRGPRGDMTAHAIAAWALCEAYANTQDKELLAPVQLSINFIEAQQGKETGGWKDDVMADLSVVTSAWQLHAFKSAHMAYLNVKKDTVLGAMKFLDNVQLEGGSAYPGVTGKREHQATAAGLLSRLMLGWKKSKPEVAKGLANVGEGGPREHDVVANYFTHQLHLTCLGDTWKPWRDAINKQLHDTQIKDGEAAGSWSDSDDPAFQRIGAVGQTAFNVMILTTGRRDRPGIKVDEDEFPL